MRELPEKQRTAVALRFVADAEYAEISSVMGTSQEAARRNVHEATQTTANGVPTMTELDSLERVLRDPAPEADHQPPELARAAAAAGLLDVAYATFDSPVGTLLLAATPDRPGASRLPRRRR